MQYKTAGSDSFYAAVLCLTGLFLHIVIAGPVLNSWGGHYSGEEGAFYEKIHPGTALIFLSLPVLLLQQGKPLTRLFSLYREQTPAAFLLCINVAAFFYMAARDAGMHGLAFMLETHMNMVLCALILPYTPASVCKRAIHLLVLAALVNGIAGIGESYLQLRIFRFEEAWPVLQEDYFRASAFMGHPLDNAIFTAIALFTALATDYSRHVKSIILLILIMALVAFGGRIALVFCLGGLLLFGIGFALRMLTCGRMTLAELFDLTAGGLFGCLCLCLFMYMATSNPMGERIAQSSRWDSSADARILALNAFSYMESDEIWLGVSPERIIDIVYRMNLSVLLADIENPWIIMCMSLGVPVFCIWLAATGYFLYRLRARKPFALQMVVASYVFIASTSNSFGRKDINYAVMVSAIICADKAFRQRAFPDVHPPVIPARQ